MSNYLNLTTEYKLSKRELKVIENERRISENKAIYRDYIQSQEWRKTRAKMLKFYKSCCRCKSTFNLCVHHGSYRRVSREYPSDLYVLCGECHKEFHERFPLKENMKRNTLHFIREVQTRFQPTHCITPEPIKNRISPKHCKYCNEPLIVKKEVKNKKQGKGKYYYSKLWKCKKNCTHAVHYVFEEDIVYWD